MLPISAKQNFSFLVHVVWYKGVFIQVNENLFSILMQEADDRDLEGVIKRDQKNG